MKTARFINLTTPAGWILSAVLVIVVLWLCVAGLGGLGFRFDPFNSAERRADRAENDAAAATSNAGARTAEAAGAQATTGLVETAQTRIRAADAVAIRHSAAAEASSDANLPLEPDRLDRLLAAQRELCDLRPAVCAAGSSASGHAGDGQGVVRSGPAPDRSIPL